MFPEGTYYRIVKVDLIAFDRIRVAGGKLEQHEYEVKATGIEKEAYPDNPRWVEAKKNLEQIAPDYFKAKKAYDDQCFISRHQDG